MPIVCETIVVSLISLFLRNRALVPVATDRRAQTAGLNLDKLGLTMNGAFLRIDERCIEYISIERRDWLMRIFETPRAQAFEDYLTPARLTAP